MKRSKLQVIQKIFLMSGIGLLIAATMALIFWNRNISTSQKESASYVNTLREIMPTLQDAVPEARRDNTMPNVSIEGRDFVGILEMPRYGSLLPIGADWEKTAEYPCRFGGSIYDRTLQIGATTQKGQYDFYNELSVGDAVVFTDMEGNRYNLMVTGIRNEKDIDQTTLKREDSSLTLFIEKIYSFEYLVVYCNVSLD